MPTTANPIAIDTVFLIIPSYTPTAPPSFNLRDPAHNRLKYLQTPIRSILVPMNSFQSSLLLVLALSAPLFSQGMQSRHLTLHHDPTENSLVLTRTGKDTPSLRFAVPEGSKVTQSKNVLLLTKPSGESIEFMVRADSPFLLVRGHLANHTSKQTNTPVFRLPEATLDLGVPIDQTRALGTAGLTKVDAHPGSYIFLSLAAPATRAGLVAGWTSFERGDGALFSGRDGDSITFAAQTDYGRLIIEPGKTVAARGPPRSSNASIRTAPIRPA